ncbi:MAG: hypothetical protein M3Z80_08560, partial [Apibacter sp.]|uniref:hypothetical protein n=1 Tax=Apibacter sp. TaxID=2023709 RepID=UPI0025CDCE57
MSTIYLQSSIEYVKGIGTEKANLLKKQLNIHTCEDFLNYFPYRYVDKSKIYKINQIGVSSAEIQLKGK